MKGLTPLRIVAIRLPTVTLPPLTRPAAKPTDPPTEELVKWGIHFYVYSAIAHLRMVLSGLLQLGEADNVPAAYVLCRHVFEWTAHACYMARNLDNYVGRKEWERAWSLLSIVATGNLWFKHHGPKY